MYSIRVKACEISTVLITYTLLHLINDTQADHVKFSKVAHLLTQLSNSTGSQKCKFPWNLGTSDISLKQPKPQYFEAISVQFHYSNIQKTHLHSLINSKL